LSKLTPSFSTSMEFFCVAGAGWRRKTYSYWLSFVGEDSFALTSTLFYFYSW
jgi:hypothetical protein